MGRNALRDGDVISGALLAALGVYIFIQAREWEYSGLDGPGPGFFPTWYGIVMIGLSLALVLRRVFQTAPKEPVDWSQAGRAFSTWVAFAVSVALMGPLGFIVSFALLTFFMVAVVFRRPMVTAAATAVCTAIGFYLVFPVALGLSLPIGFLGF